MDVNPARPAPGAILCALADIAEPGARGFTFRTGEALFQGFIVRRAGVVTAFEDRCPHAGNPLALFPDRYLAPDASQLVCATHGARFSPADGACLEGPCEGAGLTPWPVCITDGQVVTA